MFEKLIEFALSRRLGVTLLVGAALAAGAWSLWHLPVDAFPDTTPVQVQINTVAEALNGEEIEQQITQHVEQALGGLPGLLNLRSISKFGLSQVTATFSDATDIYAARQFVAERIATVELPEGIARPEMGPVSTGLGEVLHFLLRTSDPTRPQEDLHTLLDYVVKPELLKAPGVAEVNTWGGLEKQYEVVVDTAKLVAYGFTLDDVREALVRNNANAGGGLLTESGQSFLVHGLGRVHDLDDIASIALRESEGTVVRVRDVAEVRIGHALRRGAVTADGKGEAVLGLGFMLMGQNSRDVTQALREKIEIARQALPKDVSLDIVYDRMDLVDHVLDTAKHNLLYGAGLVVVVLFVIMGSLRAGLITALAIPMSMLFAALGMGYMGIAASLLSLGAIDFGLIIDGSVVMTDVNLHGLESRRRKLGRRLTWAERLEVIGASAKEVVRPIVFGMGIIALVFVPVLTLEGVEGKLFRPMAWTFIFALGGALVIAVLLSPILSWLGLPHNVRAEESRIARAFSNAYGALLHRALQWHGVLIGASLALGGYAIYAAAHLGGEFIPRLNEGAIVMNVVRLAGISVEESVAYNTRMEQLILEHFPGEIEHIWSRTGTAEVATDPMGMELTDTFLSLKPREQWKKASTQEGLVAELDKLLADLPGQRIAFSQPIELRMNELTSGIRSDVGVVVFGDDFTELGRISGEIAAALGATPGAEDVSSDPITGQPALQAEVRADAIDRLGLTRADVLDMVQALGGIDAGEIIEGQRRFPLVVRLDDTLRGSAEELASAQLPNARGMQLRLRDVADVRESESLSTINREWGRRLVRVQCNVRGRDVASFVREAQDRIAGNVQLPIGYVVEWSGQFEHLQRSQQRLLIVVPGTLLLVFLLLYVSLNSLRDVLIVYSGVPFAVIGGVLALHYRGIPFSVSAAVGFIALIGIAVLDGQIMIEAIRNFTRGDLGFNEGLIEAAKRRLRPVMATSITDAVGFVPMALSSGIGAEVQRPLATVVIGGIVSSTALTLVLLPLLYKLLHPRTK